MHSLSAPDFSVATAKLLTHGIGSSTVVRIPLSMYRVNSAIKSSLMAVETLLVGGGE